MADPSSTCEAFVGDISGLMRGSSTGTALSRSASLDASSSAAGAAELVAALQGLGLSDVQGTGSLEQDENFPIQPQQQESHDHHHSTWLQQSQRYPQNSEFQSQVSQSQAMAQAIHHQQQLSGLEQSYRAQGKYGLSSLTSQPQNARLQSGAADNMYAAAAAAAAAMSCMTAGNPYYRNMQVGNFYAPQYGLGGYAMSPAFIPGMIANYPSPVPYDTAAAAAAAAAALAAGMGARAHASGFPSGIGLDVQHLYKYTGQTGASLP